MIQTGADRNAILFEAASAAEGALPFSSGVNTADNYAATGRLSVLSGIEEALTVVQSGLLLASKLRATLAMKILEAPVVDIHFGAASCRNLLLGLMDAVEGELRASAVSGEEFLVRIGTHGGGRSISIDIRNLSESRTERFEPAIRE